MQAEDEPLQVVLEGREPRRTAWSIHVSPDHTCTDGPAITDQGGWAGTVGRFASWRTTRAEYAELVAFGISENDP